MAEPASVLPFGEFVASLARARADDYANASQTRVEGSDAFEEMRAHLLDTYQGIDVPHSFLDPSGQVVDCIPVAQQPSLRGASGSVPSAPPALTRPDAAYASPPGMEGEPQSPPPQLGAGRRDALGNEMQCPAGTVPMVRVTLEQLTRFGTLQQFFRKAPDGGRLPGDLGGSRLAGAETHKYAHGLVQTPNLGGSSIINVWQPRIFSGQVFSLTQQWYVAGSDPATQTVECGSQVFPGMYDTPLPCLFIYWTRASYADGSGCYNLTCGAFVQTTAAAVIGGALQPTLTGGPQNEYRMGFQLFQGNWWFFFNDQPVGYYPGSLFQGGALTRAAERADFGGETVGTTSFPAMGSGAFASAGFGAAAYHREVLVIDLNGNAVRPVLTEQALSPSCYTIDIRNQSGTTWGTHFFHGGPGGFGC